MRQIAAAGATFSVALGIGFVMQNGDALAARFGGDTAGETEALSQPVPETAAAEVVAEAPQAVADPVPEVEAAPADLASVVPDAAPPGVRRGLDGVAETAVGALVALAGPLRDEAPALPDAAPELPEVAGFDPIPALEEPVELAAIGDAALLPEGMPAAEGMPCEVAMTAEAAEAAMVRITVDAACAPDTLATLHHQGMMVSLLTDSDGRAEMLAPALAADAVYLLDLGNGTGAAAVVTVPDFAAYDRAVVQWQGERGFALHAMEFGAGWNEPGHVWQAAPGDISQTAAGEGGFLTLLGPEGVETAYRAEVYTYPSGQSLRAGRVDLSVEAEVTRANCGREVTAQSIQVIGGGEPRALDLVMTMPDCAAEGEFLVLSTMLDDLTLAQR